MSREDPRCEEEWGARNLVMFQVDGSKEAVRCSSRAIQVVWDGKERIVVGPTFQGIAAPNVIVNVVPFTETLSVAS